MSLDESLARLPRGEWTMPSRGLAANVGGEQVRLALPEARPARLTARQLAAATGLSLYHVRKGILYTREVSAMASAGSPTNARGCAPIRAAAAVLRAA
ncbi:hypothetical protein [Thermoactinospora rubra]|uniref:hypothetical protein n=1 Tax=Thermoactinospora rubra TaxID=1088767 RepID=UPI000A122133|nr:hypothetical protein [Thermoactinospora rubra]